MISSFWLTSDHLAEIDGEKLFWSIGDGIFNGEKAMQHCDDGDRWFHAWGMPEQYRNSLHATYWGVYNYSTNILKVINKLNK